MQYSLYSGEILIDFTEGNHSYKLNGERLTSCTAITGMLDKSGPLKYWAVGLTADFILEALRAGTKITEALVEEARSLHTKRLKEAADTGSLVHAFAEQFILSEIAGADQPALPEDEKVLNGALAFLRWKNEHNVQFVSSERCVYSKKYNYCGFMDCEARVDGKLRVIDFKTGKPKKDGGVYSEHRYQTAGYRLAAEEEGTVYDADRIIASFDKETGNFTSHELDNYEADAKAFLGLLAVKNREKELK